MSDKEQKYIPFSNREEWKDVKPIEQDDGPNPICPIAYSDEFKDKMNYFRAVLKTQDKSKRVIELLNEIVQENPSNYTVWYYRREVIKHLVDQSGKDSFDFDEEMELLEEMGSTDPKNYQVWNHRRFIVENYVGANGEKEFLEQVLQEDAKNYHAWAHRQWLLKNYSLWHGELEYVDKLLQLDHRNNSAWNHRYFILFNLHFNQQTKSMPLNIIEKEIEYAFTHIKHSPNNESPWSYLRGLFKGQKYSVQPKLLATLLELKPKYIGCSHINSLVIEIYQEQNTKESLEESLKICKILYQNIDQIHHKYWEFKEKNIKDQLERLILSQ
ncbi:protein prenyltransferase alpha subunit [Tieghemostelium lacteum]|uniref:Protein farnesyltransferase/geranylgeranyltransferase type-1 subunit alpha n=1 Tax=Tieghemostelium lacteum TaxID=361077 RepID=A0A151ZFR2_TIELA|nr:protein prenyltransferase alpha subunit [Tieghemostelium lacteum]|eukprot:KYQ92767.1 protein prenyltransferase alpha subunit [Tieghemostelium lacteum]